MITLEPFGGLGNRMRTIASGIELARDTGHLLTVVWNVDTELGAPSHCLFSIRDAVSIHNRCLLGYTPFISNCMRLTHRYCCLLRKHFSDYDMVLYPKDMHIYDLVDKTAIETCSHIYIHSCTQFFSFRTPWPYFALTPLLLRALEPLRSTLQQSIGVHIRRGDNHKSRNCSTTDAFCRLMDDELETDWSGTFFLATDSHIVRRDLTSRYKDRIFCLPTTVLDRQSVKGMQNALLELYSLSMCKKVIGSYYSSFSETASFIGGIPLVIAYDNGHCGL